MTILTEHYSLSNGVKIPKIGFGTYEIPAVETKQAVLDALDDGYRHIDTARNYGNEKEVGEAVRASNLDRSVVFVTTKLPADAKTYQDALDQFDVSFKELDIEYIDLYIIHAPEPWDQAGANYDKANQEVWKAMEKIYQSGKVKAIGVSNFNVHDLKNIFETATIKPMLNQIQYYVGYTQSDITEFSQKNNLMIEAFTPLARGALDNELIDGIAKKYKVNFAQLAIRYCLQNGTLPLPRSTNPAHIKSNTEVDFQISAEDMDTLNKVVDHSDIWHFE